MIDITTPHVGGFYWWDDKPAVIESVSENGFTVGYLHMSLHSGTHIDLPQHVGIDKEVVLKDVYRVMVVPLNGLCEIDVSDVEGVLIKTGQGPSIADGSISKNYMALDEKSAICIVKQRISIIGIEAPSIEAYDGDGTIHKLFLERGIPILENINLSNVNMGLYDMYLSTLHTVITIDALPAVAKLVFIGRDV